MCSQSKTNLRQCVPRERSLFKQCWNLTPRHCGAGVQAVKAVFEPTSLALCGRGAGRLSGVGTYLQGTVGQGAGCLSSVGTYLLGTVGQGCRLFKWCGTYLPTTVGQGCRLFKWCWNLPVRLCWAGIGAVKAVSEPTFKAL